MMQVGVDSGVSLWMLVKRAPRLANTQASRSRQTAQATPKGLLRLPRTSVCLRDQGLVCRMTRLSMPNDEVLQESFFTRCSKNRCLTWCAKNHCFYGAPVLF